MSDDKFDLTWNDFGRNAERTIKNLASDSLYTDVTLISDDRKRIKAHKIILSSCSSFFKTIFLKTKNQSNNLMIYLKGINSKDLELMMRFIYLGEADIQEFLEAGKDLKIYGLNRYILYFWRTAVASSSGLFFSRYFATESKKILIT